MMNIRNTLAHLLPVLLYGLILVLLILPIEILVYWEPTVRPLHWPLSRLSIAWTAPIPWVIGVASLIGGILLVAEALRRKADDDWLVYLLSGILFIYGASRFFYYVFKRIVLDGVPTFGSNPNNIYAVLGLNLFATGFVWFLEGILLAALSVVTVGAAADCLSEKPFPNRESARPRWIRVAACVGVIMIYCASLPFMSRLEVLIGMTGLSRDPPSERDLSGLPPKE